MKIECGFVCVCLCDATATFYNGKTFFGSFVFTGFCNMDLKCTGAKGNGPELCRPRQT